MQKEIAKVLKMPLRMEGFVDDDGETMQDNPQKEFSLRGEYVSYYLALNVLSDMIICNDVKIEFINNSLGKMDYLKKLLQSLE